MLYSCHDIGRDVIYKSSQGLIFDLQKDCPLMSVKQYVLAYSCSRLILLDRLIKFSKPLSISNHSVFGLFLFFQSKLAILLWYKCNVEGAVIRVACDTKYICHFPSMNRHKYNDM